MNKKHWFIYAAIATYVSFIDKAIWSYFFAKGQVAVAILVFFFTMLFFLVIRGGAKKETTSI